MPKRVLSGSVIDEKKDYLSLENNLRTMILQLTGGLVVTVGFYFAWQNVNVAQENLKMSLKQNEAERLDKAITMMKEEKAEVRALAITTLRRIGLSSNENRSDVIPIFLDHVKKWSEDRSRPEPAPRDRITSAPRDIEAIFEALSELFDRTFDRSDTETPKINLEDFDLAGINLANLRFRNLTIKKAILINAIFSGSTALSVDLNGADLTGADFKGVVFEEVRFNGSTLSGAKFNGATMRKASFASANLKGADFAEANIAGADFRNADLELANFIGAKNLSADMFVNAKNIEKALFSQQLKDEIRQLMEKSP